MIGPSQVVHNFNAVGKAFSPLQIELDGIAVLTSGMKGQGHPVVRLQIGRRQFDEFTPVSDSRFVISRSMARLCHIVNIFFIVMDMTQGRSQGGHCLGKLIEKVLSLTETEPCFMELLVELECFLV